MIYLDSAATTFQKPLSVSYAMQRAMRTMSSPGRGGYAAARAAEETAFRCRSLAAELFGVPSPEQVVFTSNATHALNIAIRSLVPEGGRVAVSGYEHNAVTRPLHALGARIKVAASPLFDRAALLRAFENSISPELDAVVCTHVSNVFGFVLPIEEIAALCRAEGVPLIVDASQSAGILPLELDTLGAAFIAMPGHKARRGRDFCCARTTPRRSSTAARAARRSSRPCRTSCRTGWRPARTICPASRAWRQGCASCGKDGSVSSATSAR